MKLIIQKAKSSDARRISYLIRRNTDMIAANNYSPHQKIAWKKANTPAKIKASLQHKTIFCAFLHSYLVGTIALHENELMGLYINYAKTGLGIGKALLHHVETYAKANGVEEIILSATPAGLGFYQRHGYSPGGPVVVNVNGVDFRETRMTKWLG